MPEAPVLKDEYTARLGHNIVSSLHVVRMEGRCSSLQRVVFCGQSVVDPALTIQIEMECEE